MLQGPPQVAPSATNFSHCLNVSQSLSPPLWSKLQTSPPCSGQSVARTPIMVASLVVTYGHRQIALWSGSLGSGSHFAPQQNWKGLKGSQSPAFMSGTKELAPYTPKVEYSSPSAIAASRASPVTGGSLSCSRNRCTQLAPALAGPGPTLTDAS